MRRLIYKIVVIIMTTLSSNIEIISTMLIDHPIDTKFLLGEGTFCKIYKTKTDYALKIIKETGFVNEIINETIFLNYLSHPNILKPISVQFNPYMMLMPMADYTLNDIQFALTVDNIKSIFKQILMGVEHIHSKNIIHRDLKPSNILINHNRNRDDETPKYTALLSDFGLSIPDHKFPKNHEMVTIWWRAPEMCYGETNYTKSIDIWSVGVMLFNVFAGCVLMKEKTPEFFVRDIVSLIGRPTTQTWNNTEAVDYFSRIKPSKSNNLEIAEVWNEISRNDHDLYDLLRGMLCYRDTPRFTATQALKSPWFDDIKPKKREISEQLPPPPPPITILNESADEVSRICKSYKVTSKFAALVAHLIKKYDYSFSIHYLILIVNNLYDDYSSKSFKHINTVFSILTATKLDIYLDSNVTIVESE